MRWNSLAQARSGKYGEQRFYAHFYLALLAEARSEVSRAKEQLQACLASEYMAENEAKKSKGGTGDLMANLARLHGRLRGWDRTTDEKEMEGRGEKKVVAKL